MPTLVPDLVWRDGEFRRGLAVSFSTTSGRITGITRADAPSAGTTPVYLRGKAMLPGFVNAHSHAFQRVIRGETQWRPDDDSVSDFWSWRKAMYGAVGALTPEEIFEVSRFCFIEMLAAGITSVGEFHYLQCDEAGRPYADPTELASRVIAAAEDAGIRIRLLNVAYATGGIGRELEPAQRRFATPDLDRFLGATESLVQAMSGRPLVSIGIAPHSIRAVPREWLRPIHAFAARLDVPFHMHASEQPAEIAASLDAWGKRPIEVIAAEDALDARTTVVHATHITRTEVTMLGEARATVCACPTTERDLGDGFLPGLELLQAGAQIAIGTDSQTVIDPFEDLRLIEYHERLRRLQRVVLKGGAKDGRKLIAPGLLTAGSEAGAESLRIDAGGITDGALADFIAVDLEHRALAGWRDDTLSAHLTLSAPAGVVSDAWVGGVQVIGGGRHRLDAESRTGFDRVARRVASLS